MKRLTFSIALLLPAVVMAGQVNLMPSSFVLAPGAGAQSLLLSNPGDEAVTYQVSGLAWSQDSTGHESQTASNDILTSPSVLTVQPHAKRVIRVMNTHLSPSPTYYRLSVRELPPPPSTTKHAGMTLMVSYMLPMGYEPTSAAPAHLAAHLESDGHLLLENTGGRHAMINAIGPASSTKPWKEGALGWVLPGGALRYSFPGVELTHGQSIQVIDGKQPVTLTVE